mmetsp:Transcript_30888/g.42811  ORF Transcript_30888/g.42811 Transcript_30888/m.42811 type:complete len:414 (-) Transcript_30888:321-1562(-)|eukprot:CAMPEP_0196589658 /NCGR_PEP_ID=MMETSP1081-20130531/64224_1 /TAXON_ID=36882 /ORGANISM="Pyramimonas amylifera, Strain CCMP720" /LENGTH=413 /DNA_ID=CAMNT_0041912519 /DNA_START=56 /DNA_END=1297 /DNA_ORIENTATION=-
MNLAARSTFSLSPSLSVRLKTNAEPKKLLCNTSVRQSKSVKVSNHTRAVCGNLFEQSSLGTSISFPISRGHVTRSKSLGPLYSSNGSAAGTSADPEPTKDAGDKKRLLFYFTLWYVFNIVFNIFNKTTLNAFPFPWLLSTIQLGCGIFYVSVLWILKLQPLPQVPKEFYIGLVPVAFFHTVGHVSACVSFSKMAVSFTHIIKAAEPVISVILSAPLMGEVYSLPVYLSLLPIVAGCSLSAMKEVSLNAAGLQGAMLSNVGMVMRNITSKKTLNKFSNIDGINLYALISIFAFVGLAPVAYAVEGSQWAAGYATAVASMGKAKFIQLVLAGGLFYHLYNQVSYQALEGINPTTFSVGNTMKRVVVVVSSVMFFKNPVSPLNWVGSALAIAGTFWYSQAKDAHSKSLKAAKEATA